MAARLNGPSKSPERLESVSPERMAEENGGPASESLEKLNVTEEELERFRKAFQDEEFRRMFADYMEELNDPETRKRYEEEIRQLERDRGMDVQFVYPHPGYVLLTSANRLRRCYINVCSNHIVPKPQGVPGTDKNARGGLYWTLPYTVTPTRETQERDATKSLLYDVVFHPDTLDLASKSDKFKQMVDSLAMSGVTKYFNLELDHVNVRTLGMKYVGPIQSAVIRKPIPGFVPDPNKVLNPPSFPYPYNDPIGADTEKSSSSCKPSACPKPAASKPKTSFVPLTTPRYTIRHRSYIDFQDYTLSRYSAPSAVPDELVVTVDLPLLESASDATLNIQSRELHLESKEPTYKLCVSLPYTVDENKGKAQFNKAKRQLVISLPVVRQDQSVHGKADGSGWDQGFGIPAGSSLGQTPSQLPEMTTSGHSGMPETSPRYCQPNHAYTRDALVSPDVLCPVFTCTQDNTSLTVVLHTPDIDQKSVQANVEINQFQISYRLKHSYTCYFLLIQFLPKYSLNRNELCVNVSQNNAVVELLKSSENFGLWKNLYFGDNRNPLQERKFVCEDNVAEFLESSSQAPQVPWSTLEDDVSLEVLELNDQETHIRLNKSDTKPEDPSLTQEGAADPAEADQSPSGDPDLLTSADNGSAETEDPQMLRQSVPAAEEALSNGAPLEPLPERDAPAYAAALTVDGADTEQAHFLEKQEFVEAFVHPKALEQCAVSRGGDPEPVLNEVVVEAIPDRSTQCAFTFQNHLLYDLD